MSNTIKRDQPVVVSPVEESSEEKFNRLMTQNGFVKVKAEEKLEGEAKFQRMVELEDLLNQAKALKDEKAGKRIRGLMRKIMGGAWRRQYQKLQLDAIK